MTQDVFVIQLCIETNKCWIFPNTGDLALSTSYTEVSFYIKRQIKLMCRQINLNPMMFRPVIEQSKIEANYDFSIHFEIVSVRTPIQEIISQMTERAHSIKQQLFYFMQKLGFSCIFNPEVFFQNNSDSGHHLDLTFRNVFTFNLNEPNHKKIVRHVKQSLTNQKRYPEYFEYIEFSELSSPSKKVSTYDLTTGKFLDNNKISFNTLLDLYIAENKFNLIFGDELTSNPDLNVRFITSEKPFQLRHTVTLSIHGTLSHKCLNYTYNINCFGAIPTLKIYNSHGVNVTSELVLPKYTTGQSHCNLAASILSGSKTSIKAAIKRKLIPDVMVDNAYISNIKQNSTYSNFAKFKKIRLITNHSEHTRTQLMIFDISKKGIEVTDLYGQTMDEISLQNSQSYLAIVKLHENSASELFSSNRQYSFDLIKSELEVIDPIFNFFTRVYFS